MSVAPASVSILNLAFVFVVCFLGPLTLSFGFLVSTSTLAVAEPAALK